MSTPALSWSRAVIPQVMLSQKVYWQDLAFAVVGAVMPIAMGLAPAYSMRDSDASFAGHRVADLLIPGGMATSVIWILYNAINSAARRRQTRIYKRLRATPIPDSAIVGGEAISAALPAVVQAVLILGIGAAWFKTPMPEHPVIVALGILLSAGTVALFAFGISGLLPSGEISTWLVTPFIGFAWFLSGAMSTPMGEPSNVDKFAQYLPSTAAVQICRSAYFSQDFVTLGLDSRPHLETLQVLSACAQPFGVLIAWAGLGAWLFTRFFAWDPRKSSARENTASHRRKAEK